MRLVLDTNVLVSAIAARGGCYELWDHCAKTHDLFTSRPLVAELVDALRRKTKLPKDQIAEAKTLLLATAAIVKPSPVPRDACRDADDLIVLGTATAAKADCLVSGDKDLLVLSRFLDIPIVSPRDFWAFEKKKAAH